MMRSTVRSALRRTLNDTFPIWERLRIHVTPVHFYSPVPDTRQLGPNVFGSASDMVGVDMNEMAQLAFLADIASSYRTEYDVFPSGPSADESRFYVDNDMFTSVDAEVLYAIVRSRRPRRVIEAGSGFSTRLIAQALTANEQDGADPCEYTVCDPFPGDVVRRRLAEVSSLIERPIQELPLSAFTALDANDILFIDSSHVLKIGSDVRYLFLEVIPRLAPGVVVHVHDIFLPAEYPRRWVMDDHHFWNEQYLLQAFLAFNIDWEVLWAGSYMHLRHPEKLAAAFASYGSTRHPGSFWLRRRSDRTPRSVES